MRASAACVDLLGGWVGKSTRKLAKLMLSVNPRNVRACDLAEMAGGRPSGGASPSRLYVTMIWRAVASRRGARPAASRPARTRVGGWANYLTYAAGTQRPGLHS